jgi:5-methylcytosine-specific restriction endonuclease McrA
MKTLDRPVLVLNKSWMPIRIITVKRACTLVFAEKASVILPDDISDYSVHGWKRWMDMPVSEKEEGIQLCHSRIRIPEVIVLIRFDRVKTTGVRLTKRNIFIRDGHTCQYTGKKVKLDDADIDHVIPKSRGGASTWDNMVVCSKEINRQKANRTPEEAGLKLLKQPHRPTYSRVMIDPRMNVPKSWEKFLSHLKKD